jgi:PII-like signaling protein
MTTKLQLTIYVNETDMRGDLPLHELIVRRLLHMEVAGATVLRGVMGYGSHGQVHRRRLLGVSDDRPIVIIAVDTAERINAVLPELRGLVTEGLVTVSEIKVP